MCFQNLTKPGYKCDDWSKAMKRLLDFLNKLDKCKIYYRLGKFCEEYIMVFVDVPGQRWEVEFSNDDVRIEKFISDGTIYDTSEIDVLFRDFSD